MESAVAAHHRKIELQAPEDLTYLLANVRRAATSRIDEAFPPVDGEQGEDELRTRIEELVTEYITKTFTLAAPNLSINGLPISHTHEILSGRAPTSTTDPSQPEEVFAPFDARLRARVEDLTREEEDLLRDIAALKKSVPATAAAHWSDSVKRGIQADEEALAALKEQISSSSSSGEADEKGQDNDLKEVIKMLERQEGVQQGYERAVRGLGRLKREMPSVAAKMERARGAGGYVVSGR
ncbi:uncharacterized protein BCR38DRAFT_407211 [Pseudomassariella vexata]|uniref:Kinetochore protein mis14 n=1 Tax=Pseudomassariella vexata TaxID=1141098 RepID=A0A1Y2E6L7_9PEZI|nr:uncharacterized protein BCR38DRAFT_407211 [Pseudomassariella vexata]ORY67210.1 hypothetical protein BCR38DRAFT_407211 [Pseudomassariella vexata]